MGVYVFVGSLSWFCGTEISQNMLDIRVIYEASWDRHSIIVKA